MLNDKELAEIEERCVRATGGPWEHGKDLNFEIGEVCGHNGRIVSCYGTASESYSNAEFVAAARTDIPALLHDLRVYKRALWLDFRSMDSNCRSTDAEVQQEINELIAKAQKELADEHRERIWGEQKE